MNSKEIKEALEIIKEPITVNCIEYKYFDQENYDKITRVYDNCLWFANNLEQIILTVEKLEQEKQEVIDYLKEEINEAKESWSNCVYYNNEKGMFEVQIEIRLLEKILSKIERSKK